MGAPTNPFGLATAAYQALVVVLAQTTAAFTSAEKTKLANIAAGGDVEAMQAASLQNSWVNYGAPFDGAGFYKDRGRVYLRGLIKTGGIGTAAFTLPAGYRPANSHNFAVVSNGAYGQVTIDSAGVVMPTVGNNAYVSLAGIDFRI